MEESLKKYNIRVIILVAVAVLMTISGCSKKTDLSIRFEMEKLLTKADRLQDQIKQKGQNYSSEDMKSLVDAYSQISTMIASPKDILEAKNASKERQQAWAISSLASTRIGNLYLSQKLYDKAFDSYKSVADNPATTQIQRNAIINYMALSLEMSKRFPEAAAIYDTLAEEYLPLIVPASPNMDALDAPIKAAQMWLKAGDDTKYQAGMEKARSYFNNLATQYKGTLMESAALGKIAATYIEQKEFVQAVATLKSVPPDSSTHTSPSILLMIADIYMNDLKDYPNAEKVYREFVECYPTHERIAPATLGVGLSLFEQGKYSDARKSVAKIDKLPKADQRSVAEGFYLAGLCYEKEDKWDLARGQFDMVQASFPGMNEAFESAIYVADHYRISAQKDLAQKAFDDAVAYINKYIVQNAENPVTCARDMGYLVRAYTENGDLDKAAEQLAQIHERYPQLPEGKLAPLRLADIVENNLHNPQKAVEWLKTFVNENPTADNINDVKSHIETLEAHISNPK
jgi:tetratricopeptide (TPR) repeat protein